jgi:very-short-patch-repair endonuclease
VTSQPEHDPALRDKVRRLMGVLRALAVAKTKPIRNITNYQEMLLLADASEHLTVHVPAEPGAEVLRAERVRRDPEPPCPAIVVPWLEWPAGALEPPRLLESRRNDKSREIEHLVEHPIVGTAFNQWLPEWRSWATEERRRRPRAKLFQQLFYLHRIAQERPESIELVLAAGLLHAPGDDGETAVRVHLVTQAVAIDQDPVSGAMTCTLMPESAVRLEAEEVLAGLPLYDQTGNSVLRDRLLESVSSPLDPALLPYLKEWAERSLTSGFRVSDAWTLPVGQQTEFGFAPALVARRRGAFALREYYDAITRSLADNNSPIPLGLAQLVEAIEPAERLAWLERTGGTGGAALADDPLFPLPANDDQAQIIRRLGGDSGVVVEGPPGTGKTHTIANLVSALLARGQRILVTSEKAQALRVLRDKLPEQMQELCVSLTDASAKGNSDLARSVASLAGAKTDFNPVASARRIADLESRRAQARATKSRVLEEIRALRESETYRHPEVAPGYSGSLAEIARHSTEAAAVDGWIPGDVTGRPPLDTQEFRRLVELLRGASNERMLRRGQHIPMPEQFPSVEQVRDLVALVKRGDAVLAGDTSGLVGLFGSLPAESLHQLHDACQYISEATAAVRALPSDAVWALKMADNLLSGQAVTLWTRATGLFAGLGELMEHDRLAGFAEVTVPDGTDPAVAHAAYDRLATHLSAGGSMRKMFRGVEQKAVEALPGAVLVDGVPATTTETMTTVVHHLSALTYIRDFTRAFSPLGLELPTSLDRSVLVERVRQLAVTCGLVDAVVRARDTLTAPLMSLPAPARPAAASVDALDTIASVAVAVAESRQAALANAELVRIADTLLTGLTSPERRPPELVTACQSVQAHHVDGYRAALESLAAARVQQAEQSECDDLDTRLRSSAPDLWSLLHETTRDDAWVTWLHRWPQAWAWACTRTWITAQAEPGREARLEAELDAAVRDLSKLTADLAAAKAWKASMERMNAQQVQALQSYRSAMSNVGKGTGRYAERFRQAAREAMVVAQEAVPAWVMPVQQVLASIPAKPNAFDVVIVDEASQAELTSSFLLWLAPRVIVVGDDKQCTPPEIGAGSLEPIFARLETELPDVPGYLRADLTPKSSIFSMLRSRFGQMVRLREHFRCMPEIVNWCSNEFYRDAPLVPVRQFGADRLPPLRASYVEGAYVEGQYATLTNRVEAHAIADSVMACLDDPAYDGKTFGVVVLQGQAQVDVINTELGERMSADEWEQRRFRVGTPPDFQGDERNVVWLSMVVAPEQNFATLTRDEFRRRFNVAVSRAQDQLWLFHSVTADRLRAGDLRHSLLTYLLSTGTAPLPDMLTGVSATDRQAPFDSLFEQRVFLDLVTRGYHVTPQVETNGRRIDLVVTGAAGKLAVECDGDAFHTTPEQRIADLNREQELKRCGWTFWRIRESQYYLNREAALSTLWPTLDRLGIGPHAGTSDSPSWTPTANASEDVEWPTEEEPVEPVVLPIPAIAPAPPPAPVVTNLAATLLEMAAQEPLSTVHAAEVLGLTKEEARGALADLVNIGRLERTGQTRGTRYILPGTQVDAVTPAPREANSRVTIDDWQRDLLLTHASRREPLTNEIVRDLLEVDADTARLTLATLVNDGALEKQGQRRGTRYVLPDTGRHHVRVEHPVLADPNVREVWNLTKTGSISNFSVRAALGVNANDAQELLRTLFLAGLLNRTGPRGERRYTRRD